MKTYLEKLKIFVLANFKKIVKVIDANINKYILNDEMLLYIIYVFIFLYVF